MSRTENLFCRPRRMFMWTCFVLLTCFGSTATLAVPQIEHLDRDQMRVRELMQLDMEQALKLATQRSASHDRSAQRPTRVARAMTGEPRLAAIYGVGKQLIAKVIVNDDIYLYRHGKALPVGVAPGDSVLLLKEISASCVGLENDKRSYQLCLRPGQWVGK